MKALDAYYANNMRWKGIKRDCKAIILRVYPDATKDEILAMTACIYNKLAHGRSFGLKWTIGNGFESNPFTYLSHGMKFRSRGSLPNGISRIERMLRKTRKSTVLIWIERLALVDEARKWK